MSDARYIAPHSRCCTASSPATCHSHTAFYSTVKINEAGSFKTKTGPNYQNTRRNTPDFTNIYKIAVLSASTGMRRITTFRSATDRIYDGCPIIYYNIIVLQLPTVFSTVTYCTDQHNPYTPLPTQYTRDLVPPSNNPFHHQRI